MSVEPTRPRPLGLPGFVLLLCAAILIPFAFFGDMLEDLALAALDHSAPALRGLVIAGLLSVDILLPIPSSLVMVGAAIALPPLAAFLTCFAGLMLGCAIGYCLGRRLGEPLLARMADDDRRAALSGWFARHGVVVIALCRPVPVVAELSVVMAGAARARPLSFFMTCAAANAAIAAIYVALGTHVSDGWTFLAACAAASLVPASGWLLLRSVTRNRAT